jgi:hypothetical protein
VVCEGSSTRVGDLRCRHKACRPHYSEPVACSQQQLAPAISSEVVRHTAHVGGEGQGGKGRRRHLLAACCASPDSIICKLSSSPSPTQSQLQSVTLASARHAAHTNTNAFITKLPLCTHTRSAGSSTLWSRDSMRTACMRPLPKRQKRS